MSAIESLKRKIDALSPSARLLVASQLLGKGDPASVDLGIAIAKRTVDELQLAQLFPRQPEGSHRAP